METGTAIAFIGLAISLLISAGGIGWKMGQFGKTVESLEETVKRLLDNGHRFPECAVHSEQLQELMRRVVTIETDKAGT